MFSAVRSTRVMIVVTVAQTIVTVARTILTMVDRRIFGYCPDVYWFAGPDGIGLCRDFHDPGDCGACCVSQGDAEVMCVSGMPYESR